jgi:hypothetical protein
MSGIEALVVVGGLFVGYWVVAKLIAGQARAWHDVLNVSPHASFEEIDAAYRTLLAHSPPGKANEVEAAYRRALAARGGMDA